MFGRVFHRRRVLVTGHTGFKGAWLCTWLLDLGAEVAGFSIDVPTRPSVFETLGIGRMIRDHRGDVRNPEELAVVFRSFRPEIVFHLAAQPIVRESFRNPVETFAVNTMGTVNVLEAVRRFDSVRAAVFVTSDKCYRNLEWEWGYRENDPLGGEDPYSASKACAEAAAYSYMHVFFREGPRVATARAGNVIGGGDWAVDRVVPDCARAWSAGKTVVLRRPEATRPWQHVLEPLSGYLWLATRLWEEDEGVHREAFNFGPDPGVVCSVQRLVEMLGETWPGSRWRVQDDVNPGMPEATLLKLCCDKALTRLGWRAVLSLEESVAMTGQWYFAWSRASESSEMVGMTMRQIRDYAAKAAGRGLPWVGD